MRVFETENCRVFNLDAIDAFFPVGDMAHALRTLGISRPFWI